MNVQLFIKLFVICYIHSYEVEQNEIKSNLGTDTDTYILLVY